MIDFTSYAPYYKNIMIRRLSVFPTLLLILLISLQAGGQSFSPIISSTTAPTPTPIVFPVSITVDGQVLSITATTAEQAQRLKQWEMNNRLVFWSCIISISLIALIWRKIYYRKKTVEECRELLLSKESYDVINAAKGLSGNPYEAFRLVLRWSQEYRKNRKLFDSDVPDDTPQHKIMQAIQDSLDQMVDHRSWIYHWIPFHPSLPRFCGFPHFRQIQGARIEDKTLTIILGPIQLKGAYMIGGNFHKIGLQKAKLWDANLQNADLSFAHLQEIILSGANLKRANLIQANLEGADMDSVNLEDADLAGANLDMACLNDAQMNRANFSKASLKRTLLSGAHMQETIFQGAHMEEADLTEARLEGADFQGAYLDGAYFLRSYLAGAKLLDVNLEWAVFEEADYISYAQKQKAKLSFEQEERYQRWNKIHPDAPWLQNDWTFWWQHPAKEHSRIRLEEIRLVRSFIYWVRTKKNGP